MSRILRFALAAALAIDGGLAWPQAGGPAQVQAAAVAARLAE